MNSSTRLLSNREYQFASEVLFALALASLTVLVSSPGFFGAGTVWVPYALSLGCIAFFGILGFQWVAKKQLTAVPMLHAPVLITGYVILLVGFPGIFYFFFQSFLDPYGVVLPPYLTWGMALVLVGTLSLWAGYGLGLRGTRAGRTADATFGKPGVSPTVILTFYGITVLVRLVRVMVTGIAYAADNSRWGGAAQFDQLISYVEGTRYLVLAIVTIQVVRRMWPRSMLLAILATEFAYAFTTGSTKPLFWLIVVLSISALHVGMPLRSFSRYLAILAVAAVVIVPISQGIRFSVMTQGFDVRSPTAIVESTVRVFEQTWGAGTEVGWAMFVEKVPQRLAAIAYMPGLMMSRTPAQIPHEGMDEFLKIPGYMLPRALWPDKPILSRGTWFSVHYMDMPEETGSSTAMTLFGESYLFGGWLGTVVGLFGFGLLLAFLFRKTVERGRAPIYIALIPAFIDVESQLSTQVVAVLQGWIILAVVYWGLQRVSGTPRIERSLPRTTSPFGRYAGTQPTLGPVGASNTLPSTVRSGTGATR